MSIFDSIKNAIFGHAAAAPTTPTAAPAPGATAASAPATPAPSTSAAAAASPPAESPAALQAQLTQMAAKNSQKLNWQSSIVDLMKLVGLDPSLTNRKQLAQELGYTGDTADSATMNVWLHKEVMDKLAASGGAVSGSLKTH